MRLDGVLGRALAASQSAHLAQFVRDEWSPPIALFGPAHTCCNREGDWYGEHAGKWLFAAARAAERSHDLELRARLTNVADFLLRQQQPDGYLGTYAPERRFMCRQVAGPRTWDGAPGVRTWDIWVHSYLILGLLECARVLGEARYAQAASRIGDLCWRTFTEGGIEITSLGNHHGLSATVLLDPAMELFFATNEPRYLELAKLIFARANAHPAIELLPQALAGADASAIATGKAYQLCWNLVGLAKLHRATRDAATFAAVRRLWTNIREHHLTLGGGPWGGVAHRSREVFNPAGVFSPYGYVETCSTLSWIQLNRELLSLTGEACFAEEMEKSAYNDLLGAQAPGGDNWCYYSFPNGRRVYTTYWRCCKSSGPMALEELPTIAYATTADGDIAVNLYGAGTASLETGRAGRVELVQVTGYPFDGHVRLLVNPSHSATFSLLLRIPSWAAASKVLHNGTPVTAAIHAGQYFTLTREWQAGDCVELDFPMSPRLERRQNRNVQESRTPDGSPVAQEVLRLDYVGVTRGPLVYSTTLIDGFKIEETVRLPAREYGLLTTGAPLLGSEAPTVHLNLGYRTPLVFAPYVEAGGREDGTWRLTWLNIAPE
ncbi:MAG: hypothetical protein C0518_05795 [Opitutus sp.]|nr:hypothetical protein [Opitutus sp.]